MNDHTGSDQNNEPDQNDYIYQLALQLVELGQAEKAFQTIYPAAQSPEASPGTIWLAAHTALITQRKDLAVTLLHQALDKAPDNPLLIIDLAAAHENFGDFQTALDTLNRGAAQTGDIRCEAAAAWLEMRITRNYDRGRKVIADCLAHDQPDLYPNIQTLLEMRDGNWRKAYRHATRMFQSPYTPQDEPSENPAPATCAPSPSVPSAPTSRQLTFTMATSLSPRGGNEQKKAMDTWQGTASRILSINTRQEIEILAPDYPYIEFIETQRNGSSKIGKPLIFIDDILSALEATTDDLCAIVNGDILLANSDDLIREISQIGTQGLTLCHRVDLPSFDSNQGEIYRTGFDAFFFPRSSIPHFKGTDLLLGAPWWDYLLPILAQQANLPTYIPQIPLIGHVIHPLNWSVEMHIASAQLWVDAITSKETDRTAASEAYRLFMGPVCQSLKQRLATDASALENARTDSGERLDIVSNLATISALFIRAQAINDAA